MFDGSYMYTYFVLIRTVDMLHKTSFTDFTAVCFFFRSPTSTPPLGLLMCKEGLKAEGAWVPHLSIHCSVTVFSGIIRGSNTSKKGYDPGPCCLCFLGCHSLHYTCEASSGSKGKGGLPGLSAPRVLNCRHNTLALCLHWVLLNSHH